MTAGRIVAVGEVGEAQHDIDATGLIVAPGFVDVHSHVDAQVFWDPLLSPYCLHGVTTMLAGNCGFTLAPLDDDAAGYLVRMLSVVEGMPLDALQAGVPGNWRTTADYLDRIDGTTAINVGFMVGHSALRRVVMGVDAVRRPAEAGEIEAMQRLLAAGLAAGGIGFSSSWGIAHLDADGAPVPSRAATPAELIALAGVCRSFPGTSVEFIPRGVNAFEMDELDLLTAMSTVAGRPLNWNVLRIAESNREYVAAMLAAGEHAAGRGAKVVALNMPIPTRARFSFGTGFALDPLPGLAPLFTLPVDERIATLRDPAWRRRLDDGARRATGVLADKVPFDALLDIVCADRLHATFGRLPCEPSPADWRAMLAAWRSRRAVIGASDAGAHLDFTANFDYPVNVLERAVRHHQVLSLAGALARGSRSPPDRSPSTPVRSPPAGYHRLRQPRRRHDLRRGEHRLGHARHPPRPPRRRRPSLRRAQWFRAGDRRRDHGGGRRQPHRRLPRPGVAIWHRHRHAVARPLKSSFLPPRPSGGSARVSLRGVGDVRDRWRGRFVPTTASTIAW
jgi:N-acyl-D-aspartate/D-glutamate deacylase